MRLLSSVLVLVCASFLATAETANRDAVEKLLSRIPLSFERNAGQAAKSAAWVAHAGGQSLAIDATGATVASPSANGSGAMRMEFVNARPNANGKPLDPLPGKTNYLVGRDESRWIRNLETYARVEYDNVYDGVDVVWYGNQGQLEYDFVVRSDADPNQIRVRFGGGARLAVEPGGDVRIETPTGEMKLRLPAVYQESAGARKPVGGRYVLRPGNEVGFELGDYDKTRPLVIDPTLAYGTYFGSGLTMRGIATDAQGNVYIGGFADAMWGAAVPVVNAMQDGVVGSRNAFLAKFNPSGTVLLYSTYAGGSGIDTVSSFAVDASGEVMVTGHTTSTDFPLVNPIQSTGDKSHATAFAFKLNAGASAFVYSTYVGPASSSGSAIAADGAGNAYITGSSPAGFTSTTGAAQTTFGGGTTDAFVVRLGPDGTLIYGTLLGGSGADAGTAITVDAQGNAYIAGTSDSPSFPNSPAGARAGNGGGMDTFVAKLTPNGNAVSWLAVLGGSGTDSPVALVREGTSGTLYLAGTTSSADLPATAGVIQASAKGSRQGFVASVAADGQSFGFVTYLGGNKEDLIAGLALASSGQLVVTGSTTSSDFPTLNAIQPAFVGTRVSLYKSSDGGKSWTPADAGVPTAIQALSTDPSNPGTVLAAFGPTGEFDVGVLRTTDGGASWTPVSARTPVAVSYSPRATQFMRSAANPAVVYLAYNLMGVQGAGGATTSMVAFGSSDGGATWRALAQPPAGTPPVTSYLAGMAVSSVDANKVVEIDQSGRVYRSTDGGASFAQVSTVPSPGYGSSPVAAGPGETLLAATYNRDLYISPDFGTTWVKQQQYPTPSLLATSPSNPSVIYEEGPSLAKSTDGGATWHGLSTPPVSLSSTYGMLQVAPGDAQVVCASDGSTAALSKDGGASWSSGTYAGMQVTAIAVDSAGTIYAAGPVINNGFVTKLSADGKTLVWSTFYSGSSGASPAAVAATASGDAWIAGTSSSSDLPVTPDAMNVVPFFNGSGFLARISEATPACSYQPLPSSVMVGNWAGETTRFAIRAPSGCAWTATPSDSSWIAIQSGAAGTGSGNVTVAVTRNTTGSTRTGSVNVNGQSFTITQPDSTCSYSVPVSRPLAPASGGTMPFAVTAPPGCPWTLVSGSPVVTVVSGSGTGNGTATLSLAPNGAARLVSVHLQLNGDDYGLSQASACQYSVSPSAFSNAAGSGTLAVTSNLAACQWSVSSDVEWFSANGRGIATGSGSIGYGIGANAGGARSGQIRFWDSTHTESYPVAITQGILPLQFVAVPPCRVVDTRNPNGPFGGPGLEGGTWRAFPVSQSACGVPTTAQAYSLNVTAVPHGPLPYLTLWPDGSGQPVVSTLNAFDGNVVANGAIVPAGAGGAVDVMAAGPTDVILDINGYFDTPGSATSAFYAAAPCRVADTRNAAGPFGGPSLPGNGSRDFSIASSPCAIPSGASGYSLNVTALPNADEHYLGFLTAWPTGQQRPLVSTLNSWTGKVTANAAIVPNGTNDSVSLYVTQTADAILDINGYFAPAARPGALTFYPVAPCRIADTRNPAGPLADRSWRPRRHARLPFRSRGATFRATRRRMR